MGLNETSIWINRKERWQCGHVSRRLQNPTPGALSLLQMLEKTSMITVGRQQILIKKPCSIRRHVIHGVELIAQETGAHQANALLRQFRTDGVDALERRGKPLQIREIFFGASDPGLFVLSRRRRGLHDFPGQGRTMVRVTREQSM